MSVVEEAEVVDEPGSEVAMREHTELALVPDVTAGDLVKRLSVIKDAMDTAMVEDLDYGVIPGTNKPTLLKPGAEKLGVLFQLDIEIESAKTWLPDGHLTVEAKATVFHSPTGARLGTGEGMCTSLENKYRWRKKERVCPSCSEPAIIKGKAEYGGGWLCWNKKGGCGAKFADGDTTIESQVEEKVENPDIADTYNTVVKMAAKRARVDAVLAVTGASALFTQDAEDLPRAESAQAPLRESGSEPSQGRNYSGGQSSDGASDAQKNFLRKLLDEKGHPHPDLAALTKRDATRMIDALKAGTYTPAGGSVGGGASDDDIPFAPTTEGQA